MGDGLDTLVERALIAMPTERIVRPGATIGEDTVVGPGSVVVRDLPPRVIAAGNPCRVVREL